MKFNLLIILALYSGLSTASDADKKLLDLARKTMADARYCALITNDSETQPRARTVDPFPPDEEFNVWIATRPVTRKVGQIKAHDKVTLYYWHAESSSYVTLMGRAELVDDNAVKQEMRREADNDRLYPNFPDDYLLIKVTPLWIEAMVPGYRGDRLTWRASEVRFPVVVED